MIPLNRALQLIPYAIAAVVLAALLRDTLYGLSVPPTVAPSYRAEVVQARVIRILEQGEINLGGFLQTYQVVEARLLEGAFADAVVNLDFGKRQLRPNGPLMQPGTPILVTVSAIDNQPQAYFMDFVRSEPLFWLLVIFVGVSIVISGWKGVRSLAAMAISLTILIGYLLPHILTGEDPVRVAITGAFAILATTLYIVYGWTLTSHAAVLGTLLALILTGFAASFAVDLTRLTGYGSEEAMFLNQQVPLDLRGLALAGILIGSLGVLDDLVTTQAAAVFELHLANPALTFLDLFKRAMRIGQDHVAATVNTLVLAYAGAALPLLLLVSQAGEAWVNFLNREFVSEELVRTLVGSIGLMLAVPVTTALACGFALYRQRLGDVGSWLGPLGLEEGHAHHHG